MTLLVFLVTITQWVLQTPELKAKFSKENLEKTQKDIIDYSASLYNDTSSYILVKSEETKKIAEETIEQIKNLDKSKKEKIIDTKPPQDGTCKKFKDEVSECAGKLHASELDKMKVKRELQTVQGQLDTCNKKECPKVEPLPCIPDEP